MRISKLVFFLRFEQKFVEKIGFKVMEGEIRSATLYLNKNVVIICATCYFD